MQLILSVKFGMSFIKEKNRGEKMKKIIIISSFLMITFLQAKDVNDKKECQQSIKNEKEIKVNSDENSLETIFFINRLSKEKYKAEFMFDDILNEEISLEIKLISSLNNGKVYSIKIITESEIPKERLCLGYFYVTKEKIYKINLELNRIKKEKNIELLIKNSSIVYQNQSKSDKLGKQAKGVHENILVNKDKITYNSYNSGVETGYYESFIWKKGIGLIGYRSGYGAERDSIELKAE